MAMSSVPVARVAAPLPALRDALVLAFPTAVVNYQWPEVAALNATLAATILAAEASSPGVVRSNVGGWHSGTAFLAGTAEGVPELRARLEAFVAELLRTVLDPVPAALPLFRLEGWANVLRAGQYHSLHSHPSATWSGAYYVTGNPDAGVPGHAGRLELVDPRPGTGVTHAGSSWLYGRLLINPGPGQMVVFPGWLQHYVHPVAGDEPRISVAFNVVVAGQG